jgi:hypothetical protein
LPAKIKHSDPLKRALSFISFDLWSECGEKFKPQ